MAKYSELLRDPRWQKKRLEILQRDKWICQCCASTTSELQIHHLRYTSSPWEIDNKYLVTLCCECHSKVSKAEFLSYMRLEMSEGLMSDLYVLKTHVRYFEVEKLITLNNSLNG